MYRTLQIAILAIILLFFLVVAAAGHVTVSIFAA
jgi:hypothetical protein